jgi:uncharacterized protein YecE (DUF72 family)
VNARVRIGTCSWADESLVKYWYPQGVSSAEDRLRYYAERFDTVEVDSTYYRLPATQMVERWEERTPQDFLMHVKAFGMLTRHPVKLETLPPELRDSAQADDRGRVDRPSRELRAAVCREFHAALEPLRSAGKLGGILVQFPSYIVYRPSSLEYLEWLQDQLPGDELLVEFRHRSWLEEENRDDVLAFLEARGMTYVVVDAPRTDAKNLIPTVVAVTSRTAYVRFHGRNASTWNIRGRSAAERFNYLYPEEELAEWVEPLRELAESGVNVYAMFNNNGRSPGGPEYGYREWIAQAPTNAATLQQLLSDAGVRA